VAAAVGAVAILGMIALTAHMRPAALVQKQQGQLESFLPEAERQLHMLQQEMPGGRVAKSFPKEEHELSDLYARTEKGLEQIDQKVVLEDKEEAEAAKAPKAQAKQAGVQAKRARMVALAQAPRAASKQDLAALVNKAGSTIYMLEHQLPAADRKMFPKEARELQAAFGSELGSLSKVSSMLFPNRLYRSPACSPPL